MDALHRYDKSYPVYDNDFTKKIVCDDPTTDCWFNKCQHCKDGKVFTSKFPFIFKTITRNNRSTEIDMTDDDDDDDDEDMEDNTNVDANGDRGKYVKWYQWQSLTTPDGRETLEKSPIRGSINLLYSSLMIPSFIPHHFIKRRQSEHYNLLKEESLSKKNTAMLQIFKFRFLFNLVYGSKFPPFAILTFIAT